MTASESIKFMKLFRNEWDKYSKTRNAKALDIAIQALEKQITKKPKKNTNSNIYFCPVCERKVAHNHALYCSGCGQKLDWGKKMRLISAGDLKDRASEYCLSEDEFRRFCKIIDEEPTVWVRLFALIQDTDIVFCKQVCKTISVSCILCEL